MIELSLVSQSGNPITISSPNEVRVLMPLEDYTFGSQTLTLQQYNPNDPSESFTTHNIKELIEQGNGVGIINLPDIQGTYTSGEPYAYFRLTFG